SQSLLASGADFRLVLMTASWLESAPAELVTDARYRFVPQQMNNRDIFAWMLARYGDYGPFLRPDAETFVLVISDDDSDMPAAEFQREYATRLGHGFVLHAVASEQAQNGLGDLLPGCTGPNGTAWDVGTEYQALAQATGGEFHSICHAAWGTLFRDLGTRSARG